MKSSKIVEILKEGNIVIPMYFLRNYETLKLELDEFIFLMYIYNKGNNILFNPTKFSSDLGIDVKKIMTYVSSLSDKNYIKVDVVKNEKGLMEDVILLDDFYTKIALLFAEEVNTKDTTKSDIFEKIEKEFGKTLSPMEYEIIKAWLDSNISEELISEALKEATFNGVSNLRYIDKILYEWGKKGITTKEDVEKNRQKRNNNRQEKEDLDLEIMDWNWFEDEE